MSTSRFLFRLLFGCALFVFVGVLAWKRTRSASDARDAIGAAGDGTTVAAEVETFDGSDALTSVSASVMVGSDAPMLPRLPRVAATEGAIARERRDVVDARDGARERWWLLELPADEGRLVRAVERVDKPWPDGSRLALMAADSVVVGVPDGRDASDVAERLRGAGFSVRAGAPADAVVVVELSDVTLDAVPDALARLGQVEASLVAEPNLLYFSFRIRPNDYAPRVLWGLENVDTPGAWTVSTGSSEVAVAVIDTGIDLTHPDLVSNIWINTAETAGNGRDDDSNGFVDDVRGWNFAEGNATPADADDHGTHVSGTIGAVGDNGVGMTGIAWNVRILPLRVGNRTFESANTLNALRYVNTLRQRGVNIAAVNASFGGGSQSTLFRDELIKARDGGVLFVAASGNDSSNNDTVPVYPAGYSVENVISVASIRPDGRLSLFSNYGRTTVDLAAPGTGIYSTVRDGGYSFFNGTSMAAPHVTGAIALLAASEPSTSWLQRRDRLFASVEASTELNDRVATGGRLVVRRLLAPQLVPPRIDLTSPTVDRVVMDRPGVPLVVGVQLRAEGGVAPTATFAWEAPEGPVPMVFADPTAATTLATFAAPGRYTLRVRATAGGFEDVRELFVFVGEEGLEAPDDGLLAAWEFEETGSTAKDASAPARDGTLVGGVSRVAGVSGGALQFDGSTGRVSFAAPTAGRLTVAGHVFWPGTTGVSIFPRVLHMRSGLLFLGTDRSVDADDGNALAVKFSRDTGEDTRVWFGLPDTLVANRWIHVAASFDQTVGGSATPQIWYDGRPLVVGTQASAPATPSVPVNVGYIGDRGDGGRAWQGALDDVRIYSRELSGSEVALLAARARMSACIQGTMTADLSGGTSSFPVVWSAPSGGPTGDAITQVAWSGVGSVVQSVSTGATAATITVPTPGAHTLRMDMVVDGAIHVVRTLPVVVNTAPVASAGRYEGITSTGGVFVLEVDGAGRGRLFADSGAGVAAADVVVSAFGSFSFTTRGGVVVSGQIAGDGSVSGTLGSEGLFAGARVDAPADEGPLDGLYEGWVLYGSERATASVRRGSVTLAIEETGGGRVATGSIGADGVFSFSTQEGANWAGSITDGRLRLDLARPGAVARRAVLLREGVVPESRLFNLSTRGQAGTGDDTLIAGFVVSGGGTLPVLVRGVGPGLEEYGVGNRLERPALRLLGSAGVVAENAGWDAGGDVATLLAATARAGAFDLAAGSADAALVSEVGAGEFSGEVTPAAGVANGGNVLAEVFDAGFGSETARLINLSARLRVGEGDAIAIGGFVIGGRDPALVLVRGVGQSLQGFSVAGVLALPELIVFEGGTAVARSESWSEGPARRVVEETMARVGAFELPERSADAALLLYLPPGAYTAQVRGREGLTGVALVEVYDAAGW
ncbi:S8 family serine peptidase [Congregicoccus parvus]|uniref:S8 family serine peptidase n=1 Tax=Congregicoccus parvus TaxID=3081749 RepID=UPI003FA566A2